MYTKTTRFYFKLVCGFMLTAVLAACSDGGGGGDRQTPVGDVSGTWDITARTTVTSNPQGVCSNETDYYDLTVDQSIDNISISTPVDCGSNRTFTGSLSGNNLAWTGSYCEDGGTTTIKNMDLTVAPDCNSLSGSSNWSWSGSGYSCSGTTSISGTRQNAIGCGSNGNDSSNDSSSDSSSDSSIGGSAKFDGFDDINMFVGAYWDYSWKFVQKANSDAPRTKTGVMRIELIDSVTTVDIPGTEFPDGPTTIYKTLYSKLSGSDYPLKWSGWEYLGFINGVMYIGEDKGDGKFAVPEVFNPNKGTVYIGGFMGFYFSASRDETISWGTISNEFLTTAAVVVSEPYYKPECETIAGQRICGDEYANYTVKEFYIPHVGFGGWLRKGTSIFSGGGYIDIFESEMNIGLINTNTYDMNKL